MRGSLNWLLYIREGLSKLCLHESSNPGSTPSGRKLSFQQSTSGCGLSQSHQLQSSCRLGGVHTGGENRAVD